MMAITSETTTVSQNYTFWGNFFVKSISRKFSNLDNLIQQCLDRAILLRKCSIKVPAKWRYNFFMCHDSKYNWALFLWHYLCISRAL